MVAFKNDLDTFCKYVALRPPNVDHAVHQHIEHRHLEADIQGVYYVARYHHQPADGEVTVVELDQYCGRVDPDQETNVEAEATAIKLADADQRVRDAVMAAGAEVRKGADKYRGEVL